MPHQAKCIFAFFLLASSSSVAQTEQAAAEHEKWGESGAWTVYIDPSVGNGCYMQRQSEEGTLVEIGTLPDRNGGFFAAYNASWTGIEDGATGTVQFDFGKSLFEGQYVAAMKAGSPGGFAFFNNPEFIKEFGKRNEVAIRGDRGNAFDFKLTGTLKAINAVRNCDAEQER